MEGESPVHRNILANMSDGVLSVDRAGRIETLNPAASKLLGIAPGDAVGRTLAEVFLTDAGLDDFNQALFDAVEGVDVGRQRAVVVRVGDAERLFALTTSYLGVDGQQEIGDSVNGGVIAVFADITELKELRQSERRLAQTLESQHAELRNAYRELESSNRTLARALKKGRMARNAAAVLVMGVFALLGIVVWTSPTETESAAEKRAAAADDSPAFVVAPERLVDTIAVFGYLAPLREVHVASPADGKTAATPFQYGEQVAAGQVLVRLDTAEIERDLREARAARIKAIKQVEELENWANNTETARVRRDLRKARLALDNQKTKLDQSTFLLEQGIVSAAEHATTERQYKSQLLDFGLLERDLQTVLAKGDADTQEVARLELENARLRVRRLEDIVKRATVKAPIAGVVLQPRAQDGGREDRTLVEGQTVSQGESLLAIGDVDGLSVNAWVDEVDIAKISVAQSVRIRGDAFPDLTLKGVITHVSRQARTDSLGQTPAFQVIAAVEDLAAAERAQLRLGMSATIEIVVVDKPNALLVPLSAVEVGSDGAWLRVRDPVSGVVKRRRVEPGATTLTKVEVVRGLAPGDEVIAAD